MSKTRHFSVVGAGIAGLAAAIALARAGHHVTVLEQTEEIEEIGAGLQIGPNACRALQLLGVWEALEPLTVAPSSISICNGVSGKQLKTIELGAPFEDRFGAPYRVSHRADLLAALLQVARDLPGVSIRTSCRIDRIAVTDGRPSLTINSRASETAHAVIGADGIRSKIRQCLFENEPPQFAGHTIYRALVPIKDVPQSTDSGSVTLWLYPGGHVVHYPVSGGRLFNIVAAADSDWHEDGWRTQAKAGEIQHIFADAVSSLSETLAAPATWHKWAAADRTPSARWGVGPVTLIGDAAHASLPYLAQGAAMAVEDAVILGRCCDKHDDVETALRHYESIRQPRTAKVALKSRKMGRTYHMGSGAGLRDLVISSLPSSLNLSNFAWLYGWDPERD